MDVVFVGAAHRNINQYFRCAAPRTIHHYEFLQILRDAVANAPQKNSTPLRIGIIYNKSPNKYFGFD